MLTKQKSKYKNRDLKKSFNYTSGELKINVVI